MSKVAYSPVSIAAVLFACMLGLGWFSYSPALTGSFTLDDVANLADLEAVDDNISALRFTFSGVAGPLGRPIALASFLPQADAWSEGARSFLAVNILIHLLNAAILAAVLLRLCLQRGNDQKQALFVALAATALWMYLPLLASSSLLIVQRMTTLSATFVLLGLLAYLHARRGIEHKPRRALIGMSLSLAIATVLAAFTKENGALLPTYVLVLECTILNKPRNMPNSNWRAWSMVFLWLPTGLILGYLATRVPYSQELILKRDFSAWERLLTEAGILWEYLAKAVLPLPGRIAPFQENYAVARTLFEPGTLLAAIAWVATVAMSIAWRRKYPFLALAVFWYLGGHVVESTVLPLELYFDHRNYLPIIGPAFALTAIAVQVPARYRTIAFAGLPLYALILNYSLFGLTSLWGNPAAAARYWYDRSPDSVRATTNFIGYQMAESGIDAGLMTMRKFVSAHPQHGYLLIQDLRLTCLAAPGNYYGDKVKSLARVLETVSFTYTAGNMLSELSSTMRQIDCNGVDAPAVRLIVESLLHNPRYRNDKSYNHFHHKLMASIYRYEKDTSMTLEHLEQAKNISDTDEISMMIVTTLASDGRYGAARKFIEEAREDLPLHPAKRYLRSHDLTGLRRYVDAIEDQAEENDLSQSDTGSPIP